MPTDLDIDEKLMANALSATGLTSKREVVELALRALIELRKQEGIKNFRGQLEWTGDLDNMRTSL